VRLRRFVNAAKKNHGAVGAMDRDILRGRRPSVRILHHKQEPFIAGLESMEWHRRPLHPFEIQRLDHSRNQRIGGTLPCLGLVHLHGYAFISPLRPASHAPP
jgi:hypothetical protein